MIIIIMKILLCHHQVLLLLLLLVPILFLSHPSTPISMPRTSGARSLLKFKSSLVSSHVLHRTTKLFSAQQRCSSSNFSLNMMSSSTTSTSTSTTPLTTSNRIQKTLDPCVVLMKQLISKHSHLWEDKGGIYSLAQGVVYWEPPPETYTYLTSAIQKNTFNHNADTCTTTTKASEVSNDLHQYCPDEGLPLLIQAVKEKLKRENNFKGDDDTTQVIITSGANQAYMNCILALMSESTSLSSQQQQQQQDSAASSAEKEQQSKRDTCIVFKPYYFNHVMAVQMTRGEESLLVGPIDEDGIPCIQWLKQTLQDSTSDRSERNIKIVTITNPGNPTGVSISTEKLQDIVDLCKEYGVWLVMDNTYEHFDHNQVNCFPIETEIEASSLALENSMNKEEEEECQKEEFGFHCFGDEHVIHIFSFSKGYAMAGFRVGYVVVNASGDQGKDAYEQMLKVQDTIPICTSRLSQIAALGALSAGRTWVSNKVRTLDQSRDAILKALQPLEKTIGGSGAMYVMAKLPDHCNDDLEIGEMLVEKYGIAIIPGSFCGYPGWIRVCYSNLKPDDCIVAADRLALGIKNVVCQ